MRVDLQRGTRPLVIAAVLLMCAGTLGRAESGPAQPADDALREAVSLEVLSASERHTRRELREGAERQAPAARRERVRSRLAYAGIPADAAIDIARQSFASSLGTDVWRGTGLKRGETVEKYLGDFAARISTADGEQAIAQSTLPLRARDGGGRPAPVDLALVDRGEFFTSKNAIVPVRFPKAPRDATTIEGESVGLRLADVASRALVRQDGDRVVMLDASDDTDLWLTPRPGGFEAAAVLRSAASPEALTFVMTVPDGARVRRGPDGSAEVVAPDERRVATVSTPVAWDADEQPVPVTMFVDGDRLILSVDHRTRDVRYPVIVDPVVEDWDWLAGDVGEAGWVRYGNSTGMFDSAYLDLPQRWGPGLYVFTREQVNVGAGSTAGWRFDPPGRDSYAYAAELLFSTNAIQSCVTNGIWGGWNNTTWDAGPVTFCDPVVDGWVTICTVASCSPDYGTAGTRSNGNWGRERAVSEPRRTRRWPRSKRRASTCRIGISQTSAQ